MQQNQSVNEQGEAPKLPELTTNAVIKNFEHTAIKHKNHRFLRMVYVKKEGRSVAEQKEVAMQLVYDRYIGLIAHDTYPEGSMSNRHKKTIYCRYSKCTWQALILLLCSIKEESEEVQHEGQVFGGFVVFTGIKDDHRDTKKGEFVNLPLYEDTAGISTGHNAPKYNCILSKAKVLKEYNKMLPGDTKDSFLHNIEPNGKKIKEIQHMVQYYKTL